MTAQTTAANKAAQLAARAKSMMAGFTPGQRGVIVVGVLALIFGAVALTRWAAQPSWSPLFTNLSAADASSVVDALNTEGVQNQLGANGTSVLVPQAQVYNLRVSLAGKGIPAGKGSTSGADSSYSVLDGQGMTATEFQQNVAYQRALEAELDRTLQAIGGVNTAIVHLAIPKKDVFTTDTDHPTASVLLALVPGTTLTRSQIRSVMHLVAGGVPGLNPSDVTVTDSAGDMLSVREDGQGGGAATANENDLQTQQFEDSRSATLQKMLDQVLGVGKSVVRVNAELNFDNIDTTSQSYLTQSGISPLVQATSSESYNGGAGAAGGGTLGQTYPSLAANGTGGAGGTYIKVTSSVSNAVGTVVGKTHTAPGGVKRLSVAVVLDATSAAGVDPVQVQQLIGNAVGLSASRGDTVQVSKIAFDTASSDTAKKELADAQAAAKTAGYIDLGKKAGIGLVLSIVAYVLWRRSKREMSPTVEATATDLPPPLAPGLLLAPEEQLALSPAAFDVLGSPNADILDPTLERERLRDEVAKFVDQQPDEIASIVQGWLGQRKN